MKILYRFSDPKPNFGKTGGVVERITPLENHKYKWEVLVEFTTAGYERFIEIHQPEADQYELYKVAIIGK
jgi:hypothetical protein